MKKESEIAHSVYRDKSRHWHFLMLLLPSIVFVLILAFFLNSKQSITSEMTTTPAPVVRTYLMKAGEQELSVRLAKTQSEHRQGLSGVTELGENEGMLFVFQGKTRTSFWMKDMLIPLDMIWIVDNKIIQIDANAQVPAQGTPDTQLKLYLPNSEIEYVLEVNAGFSKKHGIKVGDTVTIPAS